jgi:hypothetical protein
MKKKSIPFMHFVLLTNGSQCDQLLYIPVATIVTRQTCVLKKKPLSHSLQSPNFFLFLSSPFPIRYWWTIGRFYSEFNNNV